MKSFLHDFLTFFVIVDPIGTLPMFLGLTSRLTIEQRGQIARRAIVCAACVLMAFIAGGQFILTSIGVSLTAFKIAGGVILFLFGLQMIFHVGHEQPQTESDHDVAIFPLAVPSIAGPGAMLAVILLTKGQNYTVFEQTIKAITLLLVLFVTFLIFLKAHRIEKIIGKTGINVAGRVMGILFSAVATETILAGIMTFKPS